MSLIHTYIHDLVLSNEYLHAIHIHTQSSHQTDTVLPQFAEMQIEMPLSEKSLNDFLITAAGSWIDELHV